MQTPAQSTRTKLRRRRARRKPVAGAWSLWCRCLPSPRRHPTVPSLVHFLPIQERNVRHAKLDHATLQGVPSGGITSEFGNQGLSQTVSRGDNGDEAVGASGDAEAEPGKVMALEVTVDVTAGTARVTGGDPAAAAGLEILCHGRRMVVLMSTSGNDMRCVPGSFRKHIRPHLTLALCELVRGRSVKALAESRRAVRAPAWNQGLIPPYPPQATTAREQPPPSPTSGSQHHHHHHHHHRQPGTDSMPHQYQGQPEAAAHWSGGTHQELSPPTSPGTAYHGSRHSTSTTAHGRIVHQVCDTIFATMHVHPASQKHCVDRQLTCYWMIRDGCWSLSA